MAEKVDNFLEQLDGALKRKRLREYDRSRVESADGTPYTNREQNLFDDFNDNGVQPPPVLTDVESPRNREDFSRRTGLLPSGVVTNKGTSLSNNEIGVQEPFLERGILPPPLPADAEEPDRLSEDIARYKTQLDREETRRALSGSGLPEHAQRDAKIDLQREEELDALGGSGLSEHNAASEDSESRKRGLLRGLLEGGLQ